MTEGTIWAEEETPAAVFPAPPTRAYSGGLGGLSPGRVVALLDRTGPQNRPDGADRGGLPVIPLSGFLLLKYGVTNRCVEHCLYSAFA